MIELIGGLGTFDDVFAVGVSRQAGIGKDVRNKLIKAGSSCAENWIFHQGVYVVNADFAHSFTHLASDMVEVTGPIMNVAICIMPIPLRSKKLHRIYQRKIKTFPSSAKL